MKRTEPKDQTGATVNVQKKISIIVPILEEGTTVRPFLQHLRDRAAGAEVIVVYAAPGNEMQNVAGDLCDRVLQSGRGRAVQMNAGAAAACGDILWFVHADCEVPVGCLAEIVRALQLQKIVGGCFRIRFPRPQLIYRISDVGGNIAVELFGRCYGDHGIFCRRDTFERAGRYPEVPLLEDAEFYRGLRKFGRTRQLRNKIITSPRRFEEIGPYRLTASYLLISTLYMLRVPIRLLARIYDRLCLCGNESRLVAN